jgi:hypothetical protein
MIKARKHISSLQEDAQAVVISVQQFFTGVTGIECEHQKAWLMK